MPARPFLAFFCSVEKMLPLHVKILPRISVGGISVVSVVVVVVQW
jgi:hypothetical protein